MKIQNLAVIFIIIVLPISMVLTTFVQSQVQTIQLQISYDTKLDNATYDALKAFQLNTINSGTSDETNSKLRDIEASVNAFFTSIASHFNITGYTQEDLQNYVPALVYTMYDGYYIYSRYTNTLNDIVGSTTYTNGTNYYGLKPYIPYSCRYIRGNIDVVINYSLDNHITVQGTDKNGNVINLSGYVMNRDNITINSKNDDFYTDVTYRNIHFTGEPILQEYIGADKTNDLYYFIKVNGSKYYKKDRNSTDSWVTFVNKDQYGSQPQFQVGTTDYSAPEYFGRSKEFMQQLEDAGILDLTEADAYDADGTPLWQINNEDYITFNNDSTKSIFTERESKNGENISIENANSTFNEHRLKVIRYSIERNLSTAIANYNNYDDGMTYYFRMPKLQEDEWNKILNHISIISFMQGLPIGGKIYNGYSIITNTKNKELVTEDSIYIIGGNDTVDNLANVANTNTARFYNVRSKDFTEGNVTPALGVLNIDFEPITQVLAGGTQETFFRRPQLADYGSVVTQTNLDYDETEDIYQYLDRVIDDYGEKGKNLARVYYTALGRERQSMGRTVPAASSAQESAEAAASTGTGGG